MNRLAQPQACRLKVAVHVGIATRQIQVASTATRALPTAIIGMGRLRYALQKPLASDQRGQGTRSARLT